MVSRGTRAPVVRQLALADFERAAILAGHLTVLRLPVMRENTTVHPGSFDGLDLESGRARRDDTSAEIRARCTFESGQVRAVRVIPAFVPGDLFWLTPPTRRRADSAYTLEVVGLDAKRLQDCGDLDAELMGAGYIRNEWGGTPRGNFAGRWDTKWPGTLPQAYRWLKNPWCWELRVIAHRDQVDRLIGHTPEKT